MSVCMEGEKQPISLDELAARAGGGLRCPSCGGTHFWKVQDTAPKDGYIQRKRKCRRCGKCTWTRETVFTSE